jgi:hypothetical protein
MLARYMPQSGWLQAHLSGVQHRGVLAGLCKYRKCYNTWRYVHGRVSRSLGCTPTNCALCPLELLKALV